jgi:adenosine deaminase
MTFLLVESPKNLVQRRFNLKVMSKVELHLHLDCALSYQVVSCLAPSVSRREFEIEFIAPSRCADLADFLRRTRRGVELMQSEASLRLVTEDVFEQLAADNVIYAEIRFAPLLHLERGLSAETVVTTVDHTTEQCIRSTGIEARLILCTLRHFNREQSMHTANLVERFKGSRVVGLDLAGDEAGFAIDAHTAAFQFARDHGIHRTAHAGEARGPGSVWETLRALEPTRIGHGVRSVEDNELIEHLKAKGIHLEVCPSSNVQTGVCRTYREHPVNELRRRGVSIGINTDARTTTNVSLRQEYSLLQAEFGWNDGEFLACNKAALAAAFVDEPTKNRLLSRLEQ